MSFEHLDDPVPFRVSAELRAGVDQRGRSLRRRRRVGVAATTVLTAFVVIVGAGAAYGLRQASSVQRVDTAEALTPVESLDQPYTVLLVGTDGLAGRQPTLNTDTMILIRVDPLTNSLGVVSVPRDLWVDLVPGSAQGKVNSAMALGGPTQLIDTIEENLGVAVNHYVAVDLDGFRELVDQLGGLTVDVGSAMRDSHSGLDLVPGCQTLDGEQALALTRSRYLEVFDGSGPWVVDPQSDLSRMDRQRTLLLLALGELQGQPLDPFRADGLVGTLLANTQVDESLSLSDLASMLRFLHGVPVDGVSEGVVPATAARMGQADVLLPTPDAPAVVAAILSGTSGPGAGGSVEPAQPDSGTADPIAPGTVTAPTGTFESGRLLQACS